MMGTMAATGPAGLVAQPAEHRHRSAHQRAQANSVPFLNREATILFKIQVSSSITSFEMLRGVAFPDIRTHGSGTSRYLTTSATHQAHKLACPLLLVLVEQA
jgi:hypothetical protein